MASGNGLNRRDFLKVSGAVAAAGMVGAVGGGGQSAAAQTMVPMGAGGDAILIAHDKTGVGGTPEVLWAVGMLREALAAKQVLVADGKPDDAAVRTITIGGSTSDMVAPQLALAKVTVPPLAEGLALAEVPSGGKAIRLVAAGHDSRGVVYAVLELADRVRLAPDKAASLAALGIPTPIVEKPASRVRSIFRMFVSEIEDKGWFYDREFWKKYLTMLATERFNRFNLSLGLSYDFSRNLTDNYFFFAYPFLVDVPGYKVRAVSAKTGAPLATEEQAKNLAMIKFISDEAAARGIHFQLGIWTHSYHWTQSPNVTYNIDGLNDETQAPYSRDAMRMVLEACPGIKGITLRTHGESGVPEGSYDLWKTIMSGAAGLKTAEGKARPIEFDLHGKGITMEMIETAISVGAGPVTISPKFTAEHMGLPYMQSSIRDLELPRQNGTGLMALSSGSRNHMRYSFGDILTNDRKYGVITRVWPGTQRLLLWGDPLFAAEYGKTWNFCGMDGVDYFEPLNFKGRAGSGVDETAAGGQRGGYAGAELRPKGGDWEKYSYWYRTMGRLAYNPGTDPEVCRRLLKSQLGQAAADVESGLGKCSRILPLITTAHDPSGANYNYWPEMYTNMSLWDAARPGPYGDTPTPKVFGAVSPMDPQMFATVNETAEALLAGKMLGKVTSLEVAAQLEAWAKGSATDFMLGGVGNTGMLPSAVLRAQVDGAISGGLGLFFAHKFRAAVLWAIYDRTGEVKAREAAVTEYGKAREAWAALAQRAEGVYVKNLPFGDARHLSGHWSDRLAAIDRDIEGMRSREASGKQASPNAEKAIAAVGASSTPRVGMQLDHTPSKFAAGEPFRITAKVPDAASVRLWYRHVNQGERYSSMEMTANGGNFEGAVPAEYTKGVFPLQYYFEVTAKDGSVGMMPGFRKDFAGQPYVVVGVG